MGRDKVTAPDETHTLDTHAFLWFRDGRRRPVYCARDAITTTRDVFVSAASAWEVRTNYRLGKLSSAAVLANDFAVVSDVSSLYRAPITFADGDLAGAALIGTNLDPFDRMLIAQSLIMRWALVSNEITFDDFGVRGSGDDQRPVARPADVASPEAIVKAVYEVLSGRADEALTGNRWRPLYAKRGSFQSRETATDADPSRARSRGIHRVAHAVSRGRRFLRMGNCARRAAIRKRRARLEHLRGGSDSGRRVNS